MNNKKIIGKYDKTIKIGSYVTAFISLCLIVLQFLPYWEIGEKAVSINGYVWLNWLYIRNAELLSLFGGVVDGVVNTTAIIIMPITVLLLAGTTIFTSIKYTDCGWCAVIPVITSIVAILGFVLNPVFRINPMWIVNVIVAAVLLIVSVAIIVISAMNAKFIAEEKEKLKKA